MAPGRKPGGGCWTCRLRRKRCDSVLPICGGCQNLDIICYSGQERPSWMDGGADQKHMSETIKQRIKDNAPLRREKRLLAHEGQSIIIATEAGHIPHTNSTASNLSTNYISPVPFQLFTNRSDGCEFSSTTASPTSSCGSPIQVQFGSVMIYLDYVFPFLFPFYQPSLIETGRQWLLGLLCQNEVSFHIAASLSAYFFSLIPQNDEQDMHDDCKVLVRDKLVEQMDIAVRSMQDTISAIGHHGSQSLLLDRARIMEEITQLLIVEVTVRRVVDWSIHLTPALTLFDEIFRGHGMSRSEPSLAVLISALPSSIPTTTPHHKALPNTADQSALAFFVSLLLFVDIVASTSLGTPPTLQDYHHSLLFSVGQEKCQVQLEAVIGCQNWVLVAIGNISTLCAWKRDTKQSGTFSVLDLVNLARPISQALEDGLIGLEISSTRSQSNDTGTSWLKGYYSRHDKAVDHTTIANITRIWAYAAKIFLSVSLSGWQTKSTDIQASVTMIVRLLQTIESPAQLRSLSWPMCVAGCLALPNQEQGFREVAGVLGQLGSFGTLTNGLHIMEAAWSSRNAIDTDTWDIASSLNVLGLPALLL